MKEKGFIYVQRRTVGDWVLNIYGTLGQAKRKEHLNQVCYSTWKQRTGIEVEGKQIKRVRLIDEGLVG